ncbi:hypothetical protein FOPG_16723 [Fusarium oxysporum f. sp. conglutinans race 2 54008]|uniref:Uncharacterized protein n=1 Tax=Fusarium oxysporum f. sp. conglutinans race 2 54008 TaxID=1089457 RepID=X0GUR8_FUSOX|nr:hypothetical protein FOPG_16723 [Fusarium oxysporum f. sp. conglutinans race 2 54008]
MFPSFSSSQKWALLQVQSSRTARPALSWLLAGSLLDEP